MKQIFTAISTAMLLSAAPTVVWADGGKHGVAGHSHTAVSAAGRPGNPKLAARTIRMDALDSMRYDKGEIHVKVGETVRFVLSNRGKIPHEFVLGTMEEQKEHAVMMADMPGMKHEDENSVPLAPGESKEWVWQFGKAGNIEIACHLPGHYQAGMKSAVTVMK